MFNIFIYSGFPPAPPTRTSSFLLRNSAGDELLPRPDLPPPPVPLGHNRNKSDGGMLFSDFLMRDANDGGSPTPRHRANSVGTPKLPPIEHVPIPVYVFCY